MATADNRSAFEISEITLPAKDTRDESIKRLDAKCRVICNLANDVRDAYRKMEAVKRESKDINALCNAGMAFGELRERLYNLKDEIEADLRMYNQKCGFDICVSHTQDGLPVRVSKVRKVPLWGI